MTQAEFYSTSDTALATFLITSGYSLYNIDYSKPRFEFLFQDSPKLRIFASQYVTGQALTEPITFNRINKKLLRLIRNQHQWEED